MANNAGADSIRNEIVRFLAEESAVDGNDPDYGDDVNLFDSGFLDSLGFAKLISHLESHYQVQFDPQELFTEEMMTVAGLVRILKSRTELGTGGGFTPAQGSA